NWALLTTSHLRRCEESRLQRLREVRRRGNRLSSGDALCDGEFSFIFVRRSQIKVISAAQPRLKKLVKRLPALVRFHRPAASLELVQESVSRLRLYPQIDPAAAQATQARGTGAPGQLQAVS